MTVKEELNQYKYKVKRVEEALEEYERYKERAEKITSIMSDMPKGGKSADKVADNAVMMADISKEYEEKWLEAEKEKLNIEDKINSIEEPYRTILHMKYIEGKNLTEIAYELGGDYTEWCKKHGTALKLYEKNKEGN